MRLVRIFIVYKIYLSNFTLIELLRDIKQLNKSIYQTNNISCVSLYAHQFLLQCLEWNETLVRNSIDYFIQSFPHCDHQILRVENIQSKAITENSFTYVSEEIFSFLEEKNIIGFNIFSLKPQDLNQLFEFIKNIKVNKGPKKNLRIFLQYSSIKIGHFFNFFICLKQFKIMCSSQRYSSID